MSSGGSVTRMPTESPIQKRTSALGAAVPWPQRLAWDLRYVERRSLRLDALILAATAGLILRGRPPEEAPSRDEWAEAA